MQILIRQLLLAVGLPALLFLAVWLATPTLSAYPVFRNTLLPGLPYFPLIAGSLLALLFNRSRAWFALWLLAAVYWATSTLPPLPARDALITVVLPITLAFIAELRERGCFTRHGLQRTAILVLVALAVNFVAMDQSQTLIIWLYSKPMGELPGTFLSLGQPALIATGFAMLLLILRYLVVRTWLESALIGAVIATAVVLDPKSTPDRQALYATLAQLLVLMAVVLDSHYMAYRDELTGLPGRRALNEELLKLGSFYCLAMVDVDHFKKFNDRHGHEVGDQVLKLVASKLRKVRGGGKPFRYGGEEFCVVFPGKSSTEAHPDLEQLRASVQDAIFRLRAKNRPRRHKQKTPATGGEREVVSVTISIGAAERDDSAPTPQLVMKAADRALYQAKEAGRNQVILAPNPAAG